MPAQSESAQHPVSPDTLIQRARDLVPTLRERAPETNAQRRVPDATIADLQSAELFQVLKPKKYGGFEMDPQVFYEICATLAEGCMSTAWIYGVIGVHNWQIALFDPQAAEDVWGEDTSKLIGSTYMPKGQVEPVDGGFKFSGRWSFASGCDHVDWIFLGGLIFGEDGPPEYRTFMVPREDFEIVDTWHVIGLKGTGSKDIVVKDAFVPEYRTHRGADGFSCDNPGKHAFPADLYKLPFGQIFVRAVSTAAIGGLQGALDAFVDFGKVQVGNMGSKTAEQPPAQEAVAAASLAIDEMKLVMNRNFDVLLGKIRAGQPLDDIAQRVHFRDQAAQVVQRCAEHAYQLFSVSGGRGIFEDFAVNQFMLDIFAARAHFANNPDMFGRNHGRVMLGQENTDVFL